jgi:hypothetical protein
MKRIICLLCVFIFLISSCTSDDNANLLIESNQSILVKKIINKNLSNNSIISVTEFEYNGDKISKSFNQNNIIDYTYTGDLVTNIKIYDLNNTLMVEYLYSYVNNKLTESTCKMLLNNVSEKRLYTYNSNGTVDFTYYKGDLMTQNTLYKTGTITIQNEEVISVVVQDHINPSSRNTTYIYDNYNNPNKNIIGFDKLKVELDRVGGVFRNYISNTSVYNNSQYFTTNFTYTYNSNSYPITSNYDFNGTNFMNEYFY